MTKSLMYPFVTQTANPLGGRCCWDVTAPNDGRCVYCWSDRVRRKFNIAKYAGSESFLDESVLKERYGEGDFVFICDMRDLLNWNVSEDMIKRIFTWIAESPKAKFLLLTKNPKRLLAFMGVGTLPSANCIIGVTLESDLYYPHLTHAPPNWERVDAMREIKRRFGYETFVSVEPIIRFTADLAPLIWLIHPWAVAVGYDNYKCKLAEPSQLATLRLIQKLRKFTTVYLKSIRPAWWEGIDFYRCSYCNQILYSPLGEGKLKCPSCNRSDDTGFVKVDAEQVWDERSFVKVERVGSCPNCGYRGNLEQTEEKNGISWTCPECGERIETDDPERIMKAKHLSSKGA